MHHDEIALEIREIEKNFEGKNVLNKVSLAVKRGQTHVLLGLSGSGKSTLIRIILGLLNADSGSISINGRVLNSALPNTTKIQNDIGYVPQDGGLFPHLTALENITLMAKINKMPQAEINNRLEELCSLTSLLPHLLKRFPREISGGQRQRVSLVRAVFLNPPVLIMDEPFGALDPIIRIELQDELKLIFNNLGKSVLMVTHDIDEARFFGHSLSVLKEGTILQTGPFEEMLNFPKDPFITKFMQSRRDWNK